MAIKGKTKEKREDNVREYYVGLTNVRVAAINPTRAQLDKLLGKKETEEEAEEIKYLGVDKEGNTTLRLVFWLYDEDNDKYFVQSIILTNEDRKSNDGKKVQLVNSTCGTSWVPYKEDKSGNITDEADESLIQDWFINFQNKKDNEFLGSKKWRKAIRGEEELVNLLKAWLNLKWTDPNTEVFIDMGKLFKENLKELKELVGSDDYTSSFVILTGVKTNDKDPSKKYQQVFNKGYLPSSFMDNIKDNKFNSDYARKTWKKFSDDARDWFGCFFKLKPLEVYNEKEDPSASNVGKPTVQEESSDNSY